MFDWLYHLVHVSGVDPSVISGEKMQSVDGSVLVKMTRDDFRRHVGNFGDALYDSLHHLLSKCKPIAAKTCISRAE